MDEPVKEARRKCGIIMPISGLIVDGIEYSEAYWQSVLEYLKDVIIDAGLEPVVAWEDNKSNLIHAKIVRNIQELPIMIGVLVGNNANVWLECGMRLWSQKPIVLLISDKCDRPPFDISPVACLKFPVDNLYVKMKKFKEELKSNLLQALDPKRKPILSHFAALESSGAPETVTKVGLDKFMTDTKDEISSLRGQVRALTSAAKGKRDGTMFGSRVQRSTYEEVLTKALREYLKSGPDFTKINDGPRGPTGPGALPSSGIFR